jgi:hypothetical protein
MKHLLLVLGVTSFGLFFWLSTSSSPLLANQRCWLGWQRVDAPIDFSEKFSLKLKEMYEKEAEFARRENSFDPIPWSCIAVDKKERIEGFHISLFEAGSMLERTKPGSMRVDGRTIGDYATSVELVGLPDIAPFLGKSDAPGVQPSGGLRVSHHLVLSGWIAKASWRYPAGFGAKSKLIFVDKLISARTYDPLDHLMDDALVDGSK